MDPYFYQWVLNLETGEVGGHNDDVPTEFPRMNEDWLGVKSRYGYHQRLATREETLLFDGVIKYDIETGRSNEHTYGASAVGGETAYVSRPGSVAEDDGWITTFATHRDSGQSELRFIDAQTMDLPYSPTPSRSIWFSRPLGTHLTIGVL